MQRVCSESLRVGMIINCYPSKNKRKNDDDIAIETSNNDYITRDDQVRLMKRMLRDVLYDCNGTQTFQDVSFFHLADINNGKYTHMSKQAMLSKAYTNAMSEMKNEFPISDAVIPIPINKNHHQQQQKQKQQQNNEEEVSVSTNEIVPTKQVTTKKRSASTLQLSDDNDHDSSQSNNDTPIIIHQRRRRKTISAKPNSSNRNYDTTATKNNATNAINITSSTSNNDPPKLWLRHLQQQLQVVENELTKRRCDTHKWLAEKHAIEMSIMVRSKLDELIRIDYPIEELVCHLSNQFIETEEKLWNYLTGNVKHTLNPRTLNELTTLWNNWLVDGAPVRIII